MLNREWVPIIFAMVSIYTENCEMLLLWVKKKKSQSPKCPPFRTQSLSCWFLSPWIPMAGQLEDRIFHHKIKWLRSSTNPHNSCSTVVSYPSLLILLVNSSHLLFVSTKMIVLFSFSLIISSNSRRSLEK